MPGSDGLKWKCEICGRQFSRINQPHSCETYSIEKYHLAKADLPTIVMYNYLISQVQNMGKIEIEPLKSIIALKKNSQFCTIQVQKKALRIIFRLYTPLSSPRFISHSQQQDNMFYYQIKVKTMLEIDNEFLSWLHLAYDEN